MYVRALGMTQISIPSVLVATPAKARLLYRGATAYGTTETGMQILVFLVRSGGAAFVDVQHALELEQTRVSHAVKALVTSTLVEVSRDPTDPRRRVIRPTPTGRARVRKFVRSLEPLLEDTSDG